MNNDLNKHFKDAEDLVTYILVNFPHTRDDDKLLFLKAFEIVGIDLNPNQRNLFYQMLSIETLRRTRQRLQAQGILPASHRTQKLRKSAEVEFKNHFKEKRRQFSYDQERQVFVEI